MCECSEYKVASSNCCSVTMSMPSLSAENALCCRNRDASSRPVTSDVSETRTRGRPI